MLKVGAQPASVFRAAFDSALQQAEMSADDFATLQKAANALWPDAILSNSGIILGLARLSAKDILTRKAGKRSK
jgi:hypothetical protein